MSLRLVLCATFLAACGDDLPPPPEPDARLETSAPAEVRAGDLVAVTCTLERNGEIEVVAGQVVVTPTEAITPDLIAIQAGEAEVACRLTDPNIIDPTPAVVRITAGPAASVVTTVSPNPIVAGETLTASCEVFDAFGNPIEGTEPGLGLSPSDPGNVVTELTAVMTRAGQFNAACELDGATGDGVLVDVLPALPAAMVLGQMPDLTVHAVGDTVAITHEVADRYGNLVSDAVVSLTSTAIIGSGPIVVEGPDSFRYQGEGRYRVDGTVDSPTDGDLEVSASIVIAINSVGPALLCDSPGDASMIDMAPGGSVTFQGSASDVNDVDSVTINGNPVAIAADGSFSAPITTRFGINFVDVAASDSFGEDSSKVCAFLVSDLWADPATTAADMLMLKLVQGAWDDGVRSAAIDSFADILQRVLDSQGPRDAVHAALLAANPLKPSSCDQQVCLPFVGCTCVLSSEAIYLSSSFAGPMSNSIALVSGGIQPRALLENIGIQLRVRGRIAGIPYDTTGWVRIRSVDVRMILDSAMSGGRPRLSIRPNSVTVTVGTITTDFSGIDGAIINIIVSLAQGTVRNIVSNTLRNFVTGNFDAVLDGLMANLDISTLGTTFNVPRLIGGGTIPVSFGVGFSSVNTTSARMLIGVATRFTAPVANAYPTLGAPLPSGTVAADPTGVTRAAVAAHVGIFNQALHALWKGGLLQVTMTGPDINDELPPGSTAFVVTRLPPVAMIDGSSVVIHLGGIEAAIEHPDLPNNLQVSVGATARTSVALQGDDLIFGGITLEELHISSDALSLDGNEQQELEDMLRPALQQLVDGSLNGALPAIPLPTFTIPSSLGPYGLPVGEELGITTPTLTTAPQHFTLRGGFGIR